MMQRTKKPEQSLSDQMKNHLNSKVLKKPEYDGDVRHMISTGSTLLDLAISGGRVSGGGIPGGILVEIFGPNGSGKTVLLCEIAGTIQRKGGEVMFHDPEARLNKQFARMFDLDTDSINYIQSNTVTEVFGSVRDWKLTDAKKVNGVMADSLAALSTDLEMSTEEGDKMGMRRAKEFSEELRKTCRILTQNNLLMVCSNQVRESMEQYGLKYKAPGGEAIGFYSSLRLRTNKPDKIFNIVKVAGKEVKRVVGIKTEIEVFKSSVWKPYRTAPLVILFDYGIDDIRTNLQFIKDYTKNTVYCVGNEKLGQGMDESIKIIEESKLQRKLKQEVIGLWNEIESKFDSNRIKIR
jgi:recombination protein RecA